MGADNNSLYVYIMQSVVDQRYYCGHTQDLRRRLRYHNHGLNKSTRSRRPWELIYSFQRSTRGAAMILENRIKKRGIKRYLNDLNKAL